MPLLIQTCHFNSFNGPLRSKKHSGYCFGLRTGDCPNLLEMVNKVEDKIEDLLRKGEITGYKKEEWAKLIEGKEDRLVRRTVREERIFLETGKDCLAYDWVGKDIFRHTLQGGRYQLMLRLNNIYLGQKHQAFAAYPQWKITQIRHFPEAPKPANSRPMGFLFKPEDESDLNRNYMFDNQAGWFDMMGIDMFSDSEEIASALDNFYSEDYMDKFLQSPPKKRARQTVDVDSDGSSQFVPTQLYKRFGP